MHVSHEPIEFKLPPDADPRLKVRALLGHYDLRVYVSEHAYVDVGRGSWTAANALRYLTPETKGCVGTVGQFCNFANCTLFAGGEHHNELPVNVTFEPVPMLGRAARSNASLRAGPHQPFTIGHAVVISADAKVLSGVTIGDGVVLAASALAAGDLEPFTICAGVPAKALKPRVDDATREALQEVRWWDFDIAYLAQNMDRLQDLAVDRRTPHHYRKPAPMIAIAMIERDKQLQVSVLGFVGEGGDLRPLAEAPAKVRDYVMQMSGPGPFHWLADAWS
jgi:hypothetical protein